MVRKLGELPMFLVFNSEINSIGNRTVFDFYSGMNSPSPPLWSPYPVLQTGKSGSSALRVSPDHDSTDDYPEIGGITYWNFV
jgi:hypothetical protein